MPLKKWIRLNVLKVFFWVLAVLWFLCVAEACPLLCFRWLWRTGTAVSRLLWGVGARGLPNICGHVWLWPPVYVSQPWCCCRGTSLQGGPDHKGLIWTDWCQAILNCHLIPQLVFLLFFFSLLFSFLFRDASLQKCWLIPLIYNYIYMLIYNCKY